MTDRHLRLAAFAAAAAAITASAAAITLLGDDQPSRRPKTRPMPPRVADTAGRSARIPFATRQPRPPAWRAGRPDYVRASPRVARCRFPKCRAAQRAASRFLAGYLDYSAGRHQPATRQTLRRTSSRALARRLLSQPARIPVEVEFSEPERLGLTVTELRRDHAQATAFVRRNNLIEAIHLAVRRTRHGWRVAAVTV